MDMANSLYARPRDIYDQKECKFYHTMDLPNVGRVRGPWDLRSGTDNYLGHVDFTDKKLLELGPASGFLTFHMEKCGATVVGYDLSEEQIGDIVPYAGVDLNMTVRKKKDNIRCLNNSFWYAHRLVNSNANVVYGDIYSLPENIGNFDISVYGCLLLHLRDPFTALQKGLAKTKDTAIVVETLSRYNPLSYFGHANVFTNKLRRPKMHFMPDYHSNEPYATWWRLNPRIIVYFLGILGFEKTKVYFHRQFFNQKVARLFTVVGQRTREFIL